MLDIAYPRLRNEILSSRCSPVLSRLHILLESKGKKVIYRLDILNLKLQNVPKSETLSVDMTPQVENTTPDLM